MEFSLRYFYCDNEVYHLRFLPCVSLQVSLNIFQVLNHFGFVYGDDDVSFVSIKFFHLVSSMKPSLSCGNVYRYDVPVLRSSLFPFLFFLLFFTRVIIITTV